MYVKSRGPETKNMRIMKGHSSLGKKCRMLEIGAHRTAIRSRMRAQVCLSNWLSGSLLKKLWVQSPSSPFKTSEIQVRQCPATCPRS